MLMNNPGHMIKMDTLPKYGKISLKSAVYYNNIQRSSLKPLGQSKPNFKEKGESMCI